METKQPQKYSVLYMEGVEGPSIYINDHRIAGPKPWGGGTILKEWKTTADDLRRAVPELVVEQKQRIADLEAALAAAQARNPELGYGYWTPDGKLSQGDGDSKVMLYKMDELQSQIYQLEADLAAANQRADSHKKQLEARLEKGIPANEIEWELCYVGLNANATIYRRGDDHLSYIGAAAELQKANQRAEAAEMLADSFDVKDVIIGGELVARHVVNRGDFDTMTAVEMEGLLIMFRDLMAATIDALSPAQAAATERICSDYPERGRAGCGLPNVHCRAPACLVPAALSGGEQPHE